MSHDSRASIFCVLRLLALTGLGLVAYPAGAADFVNHAGMHFVDIPDGSFMMGSCKLDEEIMQENRKRAFFGLEPVPSNCSPVEPEARDNESPMHEVRVRGFQMSRTEVTLGQFKKFISTTGNVHLVSDGFIKYNHNGDNAPVVWVTWRDAQAFVNWLNRSKPASDRGSYRLPSEAEWEYACRAGSHQDYCGSNDPSAVGWYYENGGAQPRPVGTKKPNAWGLHDMSGNVDEWVQDCYHDSYEGAPSNGSAWSTGCTQTGFVLRGGIWNRYEAKYTRAAYRSLGRAVQLNGFIGFRVARTPPSE
jgi:formylglycine-generating enzyme required for sulfatase activity